MHADTISVTLTSGQQTGFAENQGGQNAPDFLQLGAAAGRAGSPTTPNSD
jgi:hypothetical protein